MSFAAPTPVGWGRLRHYKPKYALPDLGAGLLVAALAVPQSLGYAAVAGVPVQVGLYTLPPALLAYALFGSSRLLFMGPVSTVSVLSGSIVRNLSGGDPGEAVRLTSALAVVAGLFLLLAGVVKVGWVARFLSEPIITGFVTGLVVLIVVGEIPGLLGLDPPSGALLDRLLALARDLDQVRLPAFAVSSCALVILFAGQVWAPKVPWALIVLVGGILVSHLGHLAASYDVRVVGDVPSGLPVPSLHWLGVSAIGPLVTGGIAIAAVGIAEGLAAARTFAHAKEDLRDDTELIANGVADIVSGVFGGMGVGGSLSKTAANARAGARTQMSGVAAAVIVMVVLLLATGLLSPLPRAVLSAIVVNAVWNLVQPSEFRRFLKVRRNDFVASMVAFLGVLFLGPLNGLLVAIGQSLLGLVYRSMQVHIDIMGKVLDEKAAWGAIEHDPSRVQVPGVLVLRPDSPIFWANADQVFASIRRKVHRYPDTHVVLLDLEASNQMDSTTADRLFKLLCDLREGGCDLYLVRVFDNVKTVLRSSGFFDELGEDRMWHSISAGVKAAKKASPYVPEDLVEEPDVDDEHIVSRRKERTPDPDNV
ncbi:MAG: SulP family inorganic anion transporter [Nocardioidaceae bacterium]